MASNYHTSESYYYGDMTDIDIDIYHQLVDRYYGTKWVRKPYWTDLLDRVITRLGTTQPGKVFDAVTETCGL